MGGAVVTIHGGNFMLGLYSDSGGDRVVVMELIEKEGSSPELSFVEVLELVGDENHNDLAALALEFLETNGITEGIKFNYGSD